jgi:hypothetical protein
MSVTNKNGPVRRVSSSSKQRVLFRKHPVKYALKEVIGRTCHGREANLQYIASNPVGTRQCMRRSGRWSSISRNNSRSFRTSRLRATNQSGRLGFRGIAVALAARGRRVGQMDRLVGTVAWNERLAYYSDEE